MQIKNNNPIILHISQNDLTDASRIFKEAKSLSGAFSEHNIYLLGFWRSGLDEKTDINENTTILRIKTFFKFRPKNLITRVLLMLEYFVRIAFVFRRTDVVVIQPHSLETLPVAVFLKTFVNKKIKIIYDAHELETKKSSSNNKNLNCIYVFLEKSLIKFADHTVVVGDKIKDYYNSLYGSSLAVSVVRNIPEKISSDFSLEKNILKEMFNIKSNDVLFLYQGGIEKGRGVNLLLDAFSGLDHKHLVFMGNGSLKSMVLGYSKNHKNIHVLDAVPHNLLLKYTAGADVGLSIIENTCLSYYYSLPNKFFEYILAGIPVVASDFPEMSKIIDAYDVGWKVQPTEENILRLIKGIAKEDVLLKKQQTEQAKNIFCWDNESQKLISVYKSLLLGSKV